MTSSRYPTFDLRQLGRQLFILVLAVWGGSLPCRAAFAQAPPELLERQAALQRRVDDLGARFRELANDLAEQEPDQAARVTAALERLGDLRLQQRMQQVSQQLAQGDQEPAIAAQRQILLDLARLQRFLRTGRDEAEKGDDIRDELVETLQSAVAAQKQLHQETTATAARRADDGSWRRAERLAFGKLSQQQRELSEKLASFPERLPDTNSWQVVASLLGQLASDQQEIAASIAMFQVDAPLLARQRDVESSLDELLKQLRPQSKRGRDEPMPESPMPAASEEEGGQEDLPVSLALQLLRGEQRRLLDRTRQLDDRLRTSPTAPDLPAAIEQLTTRQRDLDRRIRELLDM